MPPSTSQQIADATGLNERYVREWLGAMVTGRVVDHDAIAKLYSLLPEHAASLTRAASLNNIAVTTQFIPLLSTVEDQKLLYPTLQQSNEIVCCCNKADA